MLVPRLELSKFGSHESVVILAGTVAELSAPEAVQLAVKTAADRGMGDPRIASKTAPYPVNGAGEASQDCLTGKEPVTEFRRDFTLLARP